MALGEHGGTVTLMTAEGGGYTLNGEPFAGGEVEAENGNRYSPKLTGGQWSATFKEKPGVEVMVGDHGGTMTIAKAEDGTYWVGRTEVRNAESSLERTGKPTY